MRSNERTALSLSLPKTWRLPITAMAAIGSMLTIAIARTLGSSATDETRTMSTLPSGLSYPSAYEEALLLKTAEG